MAITEETEEITPELQRNPNSDLGSDNPVLTPKPDLVLIVCKFLSVITALSSILCIVVNVLSAIRSFENGSDVFDGIFRCYAVVLAVVVVIAETEWSLVFRFCKVLEYWPGRAMLQIFVAVMTRAFPDYTRKRQNLVTFQNVACYLLIACGAVYLVSGILCIGVLKRSRQRKQTTRDQAVKDIEEFEERRNELEALLVENQA